MARKGMQNLPRKKVDAASTLIHGCERKLKRQH